jgi:hypothetical protein
MEGPRTEVRAADHRIATAFGQCSGGSELLRAEQRHGLGDFLRRQNAPRETAAGDALTGLRFVEPLPPHHAADRSLGHFAFDKSGTQRGHRRPMLAVFQCQCACEADQRMLARGIGRIEGDTAHARQTAHDGDRRARLNHQLRQASAHHVETTVHIDLEHPRPGAAVQGLGGTTLADPGVADQVPQRPALGAQEGQCGNGSGRVGDIACAGHRHSAHCGDFGTHLPQIRFRSAHHHDRLCTCESRCDRLANAATTAGDDRCGSWRGVHADHRAVRHLDRPLSIIASRCPCTFTSANYQHIVRSQISCPTQSSLAKC